MEERMSENEKENMRINLFINRQRLEYKNFNKTGEQKLNKKGIQ